MKNVKLKSKRNLFLTALLAGMLLIPAIEIHAQELTLSLNNTSAQSTTPIVKAINSTSWMLCIPSGNGKGFYLVNEGADSTDARLIPSITEVKDFDIIDSFVYFCGRMEDPLEGTGGVFASFSLANFPNSGLTYKIIKRFSTIENIECTHYGTRVHAIITATDTNGYSNLLDSYHSGLYWYFKYNILDSNYRINDIAVTDSHIVAVGNRKLLSNKYGMVWIFNKPTVSTGNLFLIGSGFNQLLDYSCTSPMKVTHLEGKWFAVSSHPELQSNKDMFHVSFFEGLRYSHYVSSAVSNLSRYSSLDMKYNPASQVVDVLMKHQIPIGSYPPNTYIYHIPSSIINLGTSMNGHKLPLGLLFSLDYLAGNPNHFIAAGINTSTTNATLLRYRFNNWADCTDQVSKACSLQTIDKTAKEMEHISPNGFSISNDNYFKDTKRTPVITDCDETANKQQ